MNVKRLASIDVFRAVIMFLMVFVNDLWTLKDVPAWLEHAPGKADSMGFSDVIFPAFLFIVGLSIPLSQRSRLAAGQSRWLIFKHILFRTVALIVMGLYHVNIESYSKEAMLPKPLYIILVTAAFFLVWLDYGKDKHKMKAMLQSLGMALLIVLAALYKGDDYNDTGTIWMRTHWWGILGLIGWAYFGCATLFLLLNERVALLAACCLFFLLFNVSAKLGWTSALGLLANVAGWFGGGDSSNAFVIMVGIIASVLYSKLVEQPAKLGIVLLITAFVLFAFGFATRPLWGISKIRSTPSWITICSAISILGFSLAIFLIDRKGKQNWFSIIRPAGTSTLTCYLVPYFYYAIFISIIGVRLPELFRTGAVGITKSLLFALLIVLITGWLEKVRMQLKL